MNFLEQTGLRPFEPESDAQEFVDVLSLAAVRLRMVFETERECVILAIGSGCFVKIGEKAYLLTALHNLTGKEPDTGKYKHSKGGGPNLVVMDGAFGTVVEKLYTGENCQYNNSPRFYQHSEGPTVDVTLLPVEFPERATCYDELLLSDNLRVNAVPTAISGLCYIIGFPQGLAHYHRQKVLPIWKMAHIASEPTLNFNEEPLFLVDAVTRPGLSGAPVVVHKQVKGQAREHRLLGIYVGRFVFKPDANVKKKGKKKKARPEIDPAEYLGIGRVIKTYVIRQIADENNL